MAIQTTYTKLRSDFAKLWDEVTLKQEIVIISRRGSEDVAMISVSELAGLAETADLLKSSKNAERLLTALDRAKAETVAHQTVEELRQEVGLDQETVD
jgi:antitoxin YefM